MIAVESNRGTAELCERCFAANGALGRCTVISKDARQLQVAGRQGQAAAPADLPRPVDLLVFEVGGAPVGLLGTAHRAAGRSLSAMNGRGHKILPGSALGSTALPLEVMQDCEPAPSDMGDPGSLTCMHPHTGQT